VIAWPRLDGRRRIVVEYSMDNKLTASSVTQAAEGSIEQFINQPFVWLGIKIAAGLVLLLIGMWIGKRLADFERSVLLRAKVDQILAEFLRNVTYALILALIVVSALEMSGFPTTSLFAALGAAGLAIGLALKDSLSHIAAGVVLIVLRPFRVGDSVNIAGQEGIVEGIFIFQTRLHTYDNRDLIFMNGAVMAAPIINYSQRNVRRSDINLVLAHDADLAAAFAVARSLADEDERILKTPAPYMGVADITERGVLFQIQVWSSAADMNAVRSDLLVKLQGGLPARGAKFAQMYTIRNMADPGANREPARD
jgi:small conductance mechanosensitive channel